jgi:tetratricopeptide (TPR) repeat protein
MTRTANDSFGQPTLQDLTLRFLASRSDAVGSAVESATGGEVEPHEVAAGFRIDPRSAWVDASAASTTSPGAAPAEWAALVGQPVAVLAQPFALGHFPQRVKDLHPLLTGSKPSEFRPKASSHPVSGFNGLRSAISQLASQHQSETVLRAAGLARSLGDLELAKTLLAKAEPLCTGDLRTVWENEAAALLWQRGDCEAALKAWESMSETPQSVFNRGMALLFLGRASEARTLLAKAADRIPETSGWNALARLYVALAEIQG